MAERRRLVCPIFPPTRYHQVVSGAAHFVCLDANGALACLPRFLSFPLPNDVAAHDPPLLCSACLRGRSLLWLKQHACARRFCRWNRIRFSRRVRDKRSLLVI